MKIKAQDIPLLVDGLSIRERAIMFLAALILIAGVVDHFLWSPSRDGAIQRDKETVALAQELTDANQRLFAAQAKFSASGNSAINATSLKNKIEERKVAISTSLSSHASLSNDDVMASAKQLVKSHDKVTLKEMSLQAPKSVLLGEGESQVSLQQHDMVLSVEGNYLDLMAYLQNLEKSLPGIRWSALQVDQKKDFSATVLTVRLSHVQFPAELLGVKP